MTYILLGGNPRIASPEQELALLQNHGVSLIHNAQDEIGTGILGKEERHIFIRRKAELCVKYDMPYVIPFKGDIVPDAGNSYKWYLIHADILSALRVYGEDFHLKLVLAFYTKTMDEFRAAWHKPGGDYGHGRCQEAVNQIQRQFHSIFPMVAGTWPIPDDVPRIEPCDFHIINLHYLEIAHRLAVKRHTTVRKIVGVEPGEHLIGYLYRSSDSGTDDPFYMPTFEREADRLGVPEGETLYAPATFVNDPQLIGKHCREYGCDGFYYYNAQDPAICSNPETLYPTRAMMQVLEGMRDDR